MKNTTGYIFLRQQREFMELCLYLKFHMKTSIKNLLFGFFNFIKMAIVTIEKLKLWILLLATSFKAAKRANVIVLILQVLLEKSIKNLIFGFLKS
ncbi:unnamed protein product [Blepharisma stoltei]|uniref:Uncharacterized protein n=1 Tax=Blepharisma stoltei TaxID=1481888 RepID=A0AAU9IZ03_9CILI|nr:unnamed protein product [Blepharisma stoltei]